MALAKDYVPLDNWESKPILEKSTLRPKKVNTQKKVKKPNRVRKIREVPPTYNTDSEYKTIPNEKRAYFRSMKNREKEKFTLLLRLGNGDLLLGDEKYKKLQNNTRKEALYILRILQKERRLALFSKELGMNKDTLSNCLTRWTQSNSIEKRSHNTAQIIVRHFYRGETRKGRLI